MAMVASQTSKLLRPPSAIAVVIVLCTGPRPLPPPSPPPPLCAGAAPVPPNPAAAAAVMYLVFASSALTPSLAFHASLRRREEERDAENERVLARSPVGELLPLSLARHVEETRAFRVHVSDAGLLEQAIEGQLLVCVERTSEPASRSILRRKSPPLLKLVEFFTNSTAASYSASPEAKAAITNTIM